MKITAMKITPSHKFTQHVKHPATTWPNLILPFSPRGQRIWWTWVFFSVCLFPLTPSQGTKREEWNPELVGQTAPDRIFVFFFSFFLSRHLVAQGELSRHSALSVLDRFLHFPLHHLVVQSRSPRHTAQSVSDRFFLSYTTSWYILFLFCLFFNTTSWRRAEVPDTLLKRSPTDLCFLFLSFSYTTKRN